MYTCSYPGNYLISEIYNDIAATYFLLSFNLRCEKICVNLTCYQYLCTSMNVDVFFKYLILPRKYNVY